jgi:putative transposase
LLEHSVNAFVEYYNHQCCHESLSNLTPADVYFGRGESVLEERRTIKEQTIQSRRGQH